MPKPVVNDNVNIIMTLYVPCNLLLNYIIIIIIIIKALFIDGNHFILQ